MTPKIKHIPSKTKIGFKMLTLKHIFATIRNLIVLVTCHLGELKLGHMTKNVNINFDHDNVFPTYFIHKSKPV